jgi:cytochrome c-type biogenesis protein CcmH
MNLSLKLLLAALAALSLSLSLPVHAKEAAPLAEDPVVEKRLIDISEELRCLVCQNESLAGSQADLAKDLREEVRGLIKEGKSDNEVKDFLVSRYGDFVLYRPQIKPTTYLLWAGPFLLLFIGLFSLFRFLKQRSKEVVDTPLSDEEKKRAAALLKDVQS